MLQLAASVSSTDRLLRVSGDLASISAHSRFRIGNELVDLSGFAKYPLVGGRRRSGLDKAQWVVARGVGGSTPENHAAGTSIVAAVTASVSGQGSDPPAPFPGENTGGGDHDHVEYTTTAELVTALGDHESTPHGGDAGPHTHSEYATDTDLSDHAATAHGLSSHALSGAFHSGTEVLPTQGQKNALAGTSGTPGDLNRYVTDQDSRLSDERTPTTHDHDADYSDISHAHDLTSFATVADLEAHEGTPHGGSGDPGPHEHDADYAALGHAHDTSHDHAGTYSDASHTHDTSHSHTASDVGASAAGHSHTLTDGDIPAGIARDTEVTAAINAHLSAATHGGSGSSHTHTAQAAIPNAISQGNTNTQIANNRDTINLILAALRNAGVIQS